MSFLNLGSFGEGFVTGFATEANKALKESVNRINTRVDKLKDFQVQRAIKDQDRRREEIEENKEALERAYAVLGGDADAERAIAYAGGLLKERGSVAAFNKRIDELQAAKDSGYDIMSYFDRASFDAPAGTLDDYAVAAAGAPQTFATDYRIPEGMDTGTGRTLVGTILGKDIDIVGRAMQEAGEEVRALYGADVTTLAQLPTITFKAEEFSLRNKTPAERLQFANEKLALVSVQEDDALLEKYTTMRDEQEKAVVATKDEAATLQVIDARLNRVEAGSDEEKTLLGQRKTIKRNMNLKAVADQPVKSLELKIEYALADAVEEAERTGNPLDRTEVEKLENELATLTDQVPSVQSEINEDMEDLRRRSAPDYTGADKLTVGSPEYNTELASIQARQDAHDATAPDKPLSRAEVTGWQTTFIDAIELAQTDAIKQFTDAEQTVYKEIKDEFKTPAELERLRKKGEQDAAAGNNTTNERLAIYDKVAAASRSVTQTVIARSLSNYNKKDHPEAWVAAANLGYIDPETTSGGAPSPDASAQTAAALGGGTPAADTSTAAEGDGLASIRLKIKNDKAGVDKFITLGLNNNTSSAEMYDRALKLHGADFAEKVREIYVPVAQDEGEIPEGEEAEIAKLYASPQQESALESIRGMPFLQRASENLQIKTVSSDLNITEAEAKKIIDSLSNVKFSRKQQLRQARNIVETMLGTNYKEVREIAKQLNVPMEYARRLHKEVSTDKKAAGGLMSRK
jgi:hypothetical protein